MNAVNQDRKAGVLPRAEPPSKGSDHHEGVHGLRKIFFLVDSLNLGGTEQATEVVVALQHTAGYLRSELSHRFKLYSVPQLHFIYDDSIESGLRLSKLIDDAVADDHKHSS